MKKKNTQERILLSIFMTNFISKIKEIHNLSDEKERQLHQMAEKDICKWYGK